jgi:hypothetical protein
MTNTLFAKYGRKWMLYGGLLFPIAYAALTVTSQPAYAATCTPSLCETYETACVAFCESRGGVKEFTCPNTPTTWFCWCHDGQILTEPC